jgi:hypothetical protein
MAIKGSTIVPTVIIIDQRKYFRVFSTLFRTLAMPPGW